MQIESSEKKSLIRLDRIAEDINSKFAEAIRFAGESARNGNAAVIAAIECGKLLSKAKASVGHGKWEKWLLDNCGDIHSNTARNWMRLAKSQSLVDLENCRSISQAYIACGILPEPKPPEKALGTADVDIVATFTTSVVKSFRSIELKLKDIDLPALNEQHKQAIREVIDQVVRNARELEGRL